MTENEIAKRIMDAAFLIHRTLGPGLLEIVYEIILAKKLFEMGLAVDRQVPGPIRFEGITFEEWLQACCQRPGRIMKEIVASVRRSVKNLGLMRRRNDRLKSGPIYCA
jgi:GxxExxY protein